MGKASHKKKAGRQFEELIARIESSGLPTDAKVTSPDKITDRSSGKPREVDASIRYTLGTIPMLVTIECRDRSRAAEPGWIDELISKRNDLGASISIGVSAKGFSKAARAKANRHGVLLRETKSLTVNDIFNLEPSLVHLRVHLKHIHVHLHETESDQTVLCLDGSSFDPSKPFISDSRTGREISLNKLLDEVSCARGLDWPKYSEVEITRTIPFTGTSYVVRTMNGITPVVAMRLIFTGGVTELPFQLEKAFDYVADGDQRLVQFQNWTANAKIQGENLNVDFEVLLK